MWKEFKQFIMRGNVLDLAIGIVLGAAFGRIVSSFVSDLLMPPIGLALGHMDFSNLFIDLSGHGYPSLAAAKAAGAPTINYGVFINTLIDFLIIAAAIFFVVKGVNAMRRREADKPAVVEPTTTEKLLMEIRDLTREAAQRQSPALPLRQSSADANPHPGLPM